MNCTKFVLFKICVYTISEYYTIESKEFFSVCKFVIFRLKKSLKIRILNEFFVIFNLKINSRLEIFYFVCKYL